MTATTATSTVTAVDTGIDGTGPVTRRRSSRTARAACVVAAVATNCAIFTAGKAAGVDFTIAADGHAPAPFVLPEIAVVTLVIGLLGWACLAVLERYSRHARIIWFTLATAVVLISLPPIWMVQATTDTRVLLVAIHVALGVALAPMTHRSR